MQYCLISLQNSLMLALQKNLETRSYPQGPRPSFNPSKSSSNGLDHTCTNENKNTQNINIYKNLKWKPKS